MLQDSVVHTAAPSDLTDFAELETMLAESMSARSRSVSTSRRESDSFMTPVDWTQALCWVTQFTVAFFIESRCEGCGSIHRTFSHWAAWQTFSKKATGKPSCWKKLDERPEGELQAPRFITKDVPVCEDCFKGLESGMDYRTLTEEM